ncbi:MAG: polysaccharide biosynthesis/export family protein, partial [Verrucomicrobia bacterium]|nr:polysaccharide biosynthesis/export family protein [Verrucomicrobiota bacterium]
RLNLLSFALIGALLFASGCNTQRSEGSGNPKLPEAGSVANLRPGDTLVITLQGVPDPTANSVQIDEQGLVTLPYIGQIAAAGTTTASLSQKIRETYVSKKFYTNVDVAVSVTERFVYVGGEVVRPGRIIWTPDLTVTKAIQAAGGFTLYAKETRINLVRDRVAYPIDATLAQKSPMEDPRLMPGDSIQAPKSAF